MSLEALKRNGHNLDLGRFDVAGEYDIPVIEPVHFDKNIGWACFAHALNFNNERENIGVHFYTDDYRFERIWNDPVRYMRFLSRFAAVMSPDYSLFTDYPKAVQIYNHWKKHILAAYWQRMGLCVIPSVSWADKDSFSWCFDGEPQNATVSVSSVGAIKGKEAKARFLDGYNAMLERLQPEKIIFFGKVPSECEGNIEPHSPFYESYEKELDFRSVVR